MRFIRIKKQILTMFLASFVATPIAYAETDEKYVQRLSPP